MREWGREEVERGNEEGRQSKGGEEGRQGERGREGGRERYCV